MGKEEVVLLLFAINMILYLENHKKPIKIFKQLKLVVFNKWTRLQYINQYFKINCISIFYKWTILNE